MLVLSLIFSLFGCGNTETLRLRYELPVSLQPDFIFIVRLEAASSGEPVFIPSLPSTNFASSYSSQDFGRQLLACATERSQVEGGGLPDLGSGSCQAMGSYVGSVIFNGSLLDAASEQAPRANIELNSDTGFVFVLAIYNASQNENPRCAQLFTLEKIGKTLKIKKEDDSFSTSSDLSFQLPEPTLGNNCFALSG